MGLYIHLCRDKDAAMDNPDYYTRHFQTHKLSREFCKLMYRLYAGFHEPELDQIGRMTGVDVGPLYGMNDYPDPEASLFLDDPFEMRSRDEILAETEVGRGEFPQNLDGVLLTVENLITTFSTTADLPAKLLPPDFDVPAGI